MSDWKEFLENRTPLKSTLTIGVKALLFGKINISTPYKQFFTFELHKKFIDLEEIEEFFLGEVARIEKEIKKCALNGEISKCDYLEGQLFYVKELAGVED